MTCFSELWQICMGDSLLGVPFICKGKKGKITKLLRSKLEQRVHVRIVPLAHEQTAARKK